MEGNTFKVKSIFIISFVIVFSFHFRANSEINPQDIIEKSIEAQGGREVLESVKDVVATTSVKIYIPQGEYLGERKVYTKTEPTKIRIEQTIMGTETTIGFDGENAWLEQMGKAMVAPQSITDSIKASVIREDLLLKYKEKGCKIEYLGQTEVNSQSCYQIKFTDKEDNETIYYFDKKTYLPMKTEFDAPDETGKIGKNEVLSSDFRNIKNLVMPFKSIAYFDGKKLLEITIKEVEINQGLEDSLFSIPIKKQP